MTDAEELQNLRRGFWWLYAGSRAPLDLDAQCLKAGATVSLENAKMEIRAPRAGGMLELYGQFVFRRPADADELILTAASVDEFDAKYVEMGELLLEHAWLTMQPVEVLGTR